jgi:hypothetical protein
VEHAARRIAASAARRRPAAGMDRTLAPGAVADG